MNLVGKTDEHEYDMGGFCRRCYVGWAEVHTMGKSPKCPYSNDSLKELINAR